MQCNGRNLNWRQSEKTVVMPYIYIYIYHIIVFQRMSISWLMMCDDVTARSQQMRDRDWRFRMVQMN